MAIIPKEEKKTQNQVTESIKGYVYRELHKKGDAVINERCPSNKDETKEKENKIDSLIFKELPEAIKEFIIAKCTEYELGIADPGKLAKNLDNSMRSYTPGSDYGDLLYDIIISNLDDSKERERRKFAMKVQGIVDDKYKELLFQYEVGNIDGKKLEKEVKDWTPEV